MDKTESKEKPIKEKIKDDIIKSGFPLEINTATELEKEWWKVKDNVPYIDIEDEKSKSFDLEVTKEWSDTRVNHKILFKLIIECKKDEKKPWVFFRRKKAHYDYDIYMLKFENNFQAKKKSVNIQQVREELEKFKSKHHYFSEKIKCCSYCRAFADKDELTKSPIYKAVNTVIKACQSITNNLSISGTDKPTTIICYPLIVLDGNLFEVDVKKDEIKVLESNHIKFIANYLPIYRTTNYDKYFVDIIKKDYLKNYLKILDEDKKYFMDNLANLLPREIRGIKKI